MTRTHLAQALCPARHCIQAAAVEEPPGDTEHATWHLEQYVGEQIREGKINPWCGLCGAPHSQWHYEVATIQGSLADHMPLLRQMEGEQSKARQLVKAQRRASKN